MALEGVLGVGFFISCRDKARQDPHNIIRTVAYDLAVLDGSCARSVWDDPASTPNMASLRLTEQSSHLLARPSPLSQVEGHSTVVVIDALDELDDNEEYESEGLIALLISTLKHQAVKLLVTNCNEPRISIMLDGLTDETFKLHQMEWSSVSKDVRTFYETRFRQLSTSRHPNLLDWPSSTDLDILTNRTGYLFVYAATIVQFVSTLRFDPVKRLQSILHSHNQASQSEVVYQALDLLYTHILNAAVTVNGEINRELQNRVKMLIEVVIALQHPLRFQSIAALVSSSDCTLSEVEVSSDLESLASVIPTPENERDPVEIFHLSFPDYIQDPRRCKDPHLIVSSIDAHVQVGIACLHLMNTNLREDICDIQDFTVPNEEIADLQEHLDCSVPESLWYACSYWIVHISMHTASPPLSRNYNVSVNRICSIG
jgi:hypothetical protein